MTIENSLERIAKGIEALVKHAKVIEDKLNQPIQFMNAWEENQKEDELEKLKQLEEIEKKKNRCKTVDSIPRKVEGDQVPPPPPAPVKKEEVMTVEQLNDLLIIELERVGEDKNSQINNIIKKHGAPNLTDLDPSKYHLVLEEIGKIASQEETK